MIYAAVFGLGLGIIIGAVAERLHWFWLARKETLSAAVNVLTEEVRAVRMWIESREAE